MRANLLGLAVLLASTMAAAAQTQSINKVAVSGEPILVFGVAAVNPDCTSMGAFHFVVTGGASHGKISVKSAKIFGAFPADNPRSACNNRKVDGHQVSYVSAKGYHGPDAFEFEAIGPTGTARRVRVDVTVR